MFISDSIKTEIITVTPEIAEKLLARNTRNRKISPANYAKVREAMLNAEWEFNGETIKIAKDGSINDGQHRLTACVELGIPFKTVIVYGLPRETQDSVDTGKSRTLGDVFVLNGIKDANNTAAIVSAVLRWEKYGLRQALVGSSVYPITNKTALDRVQSEPSLADLKRQMKHVSRITAGTRVPGLLYYVFSGIDQEDADYFFSRLGDGAGLNPGDPILTLRNTLISISSERGKPNPTYIGALIIKAWNKFRDGEQAKVLRFTPGGANPERFPEPK